MAQTLYSKELRQVAKAWNMLKGCCTSRVKLLSSTLPNWRYTESESCLLAKLKFFLLTFLMDPPTRLAVSLNVS